MPSRPGRAIRGHRAAARCPPRHAARCPRTRPCAVPEYAWFLFSTESENAHPDLLPRLLHRLEFLAAVAEALARGLDGQLGEVAEERPLRELAAGQGVVPDLSRLLPGVAPERGGGQVERVVGDAGVDVDAAVVAAGADVVVHGRGLRVLAEDVVVVRGARL